MPRYIKNAMTYWKHIVGWPVFFVISVWILYAILMQLGIVKLQIASVIFAVIAALLWLIASLLPLPKQLNSIIAGDEGFSGELPELFNSISRQSKWNAWAAWFAAYSAIFQGLSLGLQIMTTP